LAFVREASEESHPDEYMGFLRAEDARKLGLDRSGQVITDVLVIPGTTSNPVSATVKTNMKPNDVQSVGSVHSHPNGALQPSPADLSTFGQGDVHIIVGAPYGPDDWRAFDNRGEPTTLDVLDVDLPEERFFDFTQADIDAELIDEGRRRGVVDPDPDTDPDPDLDLDPDSDDHADNDDRDGGGFLSWLR
jgi:proteasome lid subunit RPN8/RPN11